MKGFLKDENGSSQVVSMMILLPVVLAIAITLLFIFPIFTTQQTLNAQAKSIAHTAEITGRVGPEVQDMITRLEDTSGVTPDSVTWDTAWLDEEQQTIQLRTPFTVTLTKKLKLPFITPIIGESRAITVELQSSASGISEVYYKP
jgi:hypothetical protein